MNFLTHPSLAPLFDADDLAAVAALRDHLSPERLDAMQADPGALYARESWGVLGRMGLFAFGRRETGAPNGRDLARAVAMIAEGLVHDVRGEIDMAIYVHGLVAHQTMQFYNDRPSAQALLPDLRAGRIVFCTAYTDADPAAPLRASPVPGGFRLSGRKWLSVNMPHADIAMVTFETGLDRLAATVRMDAAGLRRETLRQAAGNSAYSQGAAVFDEVFVPEADVLSGGLRRLRVWNRVMSASRLLNAISALRSLDYLISLVMAQLADRHVAGAPFRAMPQYRRWVHSAKIFAVVLRRAIAATLRDMADNRIDESGIAGLKALSVNRAFAFAQEAQEMAGGASTLHDHEMSLVGASMSHHRFSSGGEAQLLAIYANSLSRKHRGRRAAA